MYKGLFTLLLFTTLNCFGQKIVQKIDLQLKSGGSGFFFGIGEGDAEIISFYNPVVDKRLLCIRDKKNIIILHTSDNFTIQEKQFAKTPDDAELLGGFVKTDRLVLIYSYNRKKGLKLQEIFFDHSKVQNVIEINLDKREKFVTFFSDKNKCYLLTSQRKTSKVNIYPFEQSNYHKSIEFELEPIQINGASWPFYYVFEKTPKFIDQNSASSFENTSTEFKLYVSNNIVRMSLDNVYNYTKVISLNLNNGQSSITNYEKSIGNCEYLTTNSLIRNDVIFLLTICKSYLHLNMRDLKTGLELNSFLAQGDEDIYFKNSSIVQEGGGTIYSQDRRLNIDETKKFLSKSVKMKATLGLEERNDTLIVDIGATKQITDTRGGGGFGSPGGSFSTPYGVISTPPTYNYTYGSYQSNSWSKSTYFKTLLNNKSYEHIKGEVHEGIYDRIRNYESSLSSTIRIKNVFNINESYFFCYYNKSDDKLVLTRFD